MAGYLSEEQTLTLYGAFTRGSALPRQRDLFSRCAHCEEKYAQCYKAVMNNADIEP